MKTRLVFVSDLHLGAVEKIDEFRYDARFAALLEHPEILPAPGERCELVVLGDAFDLWQAVPQSDCEADDTSSIELGYTADVEKGRLEAVARRHAPWFEAIGRFVGRPRCTVTFVPGNHDHSLVARSVQTALRRACGLPGNDARVSFAPCLDRPRLGLYAEHGNQLERNNRYRSFESFDPGGECRGYYFVRLFWNRMEYRDAALQNNGSYWGAVWKHLFNTKDWHLFALAIRFFRQYWNDKRVKARITPFVAEAGKAAPAPDVHVDLPGAPALLAAGRPARGRLFAADAETERMFREAYQASPEVRKEVDAILAETRAASPATPQLDATPAAAPAGYDEINPAGPPDDVLWATQLSEGKGSFPMKAKAYRFVIIGHTHDERFQRLDNEAVYVNTGTWTRGGRLPVALAAPNARGRPETWLAHLDENGRLG